MAAQVLSRPAKFAEKFTTFEDRVRRLEDSTGQGFADKSTIFADGRDPRRS